MTFVFGTDYTNECSGIINLIGGDIGFRSGTLRVIGQDEFEPIFNNFGTINGIDSDLGEEIAIVQLVSAPSIPVFNNHGTLTAPVIGNTFNDNLPNQCTPDLHPSILTEVQNIEEKLDGDRLSLITQISNDIVSMLTSIAQILGILQDPNFGLEEIKEEVSSIEENMNIGATKSLSVDVNGGSTFIIGAPDSEFPTPNVVITNPFDPPRDSNIKICVDATSFTGKVGSLVRLKLDVAGDGDFSVHSEAMGAEDQGPKKGVVDGKLKNVICREVAAKEFQLVIINNDVGIKNVEAAIIWNTGNKIIP